MAKNAQNFEERPWGTFEVLNEFQVTSSSGKEEDVIVKKLVVYPNKRLSYQSHKLRAESWNIVQGNGIAIIDGQDIVLRQGGVIHVPIGTRHRIINESTSDNLIAIEVGRGEFDEFDIERFEDDFGRT